METSQTIYIANQMVSFSENGKNTKNIKVLVEHWIKLNIAKLIKH